MLLSGGERMAVRAVLFDGYGTLFEGAMEALVETCIRVVREHALPTEPEDFFQTWDSYFFPLIHSADFITLREAHLVSLRQAFEQLQVESEPEHYVDPIFSAMGRASLYADVRPSLAGLDGFLTGIVSNADEDHLQEAIQRNGLDLPVIVSSESARCYKPNPEIFQQAFAALPCAPHQALYVGDSQEDDIVGARRAGMKVAWLNRRGEALKPEIPQPDYEIRSLRELEGIV
jgi:2-haloalkanoic acid dehalogenase type II